MTEKHVNFMIATTRNILLSDLLTYLLPKHLPVSTENQQMGLSKKLNGRPGDERRSGIEEKAWEKIARNYCKKNTWLCPSSGIPKASTEIHQKKGTEYSSGRKI